MRGRLAAATTALVLMMLAGCGGSSSSGPAVKVEGQGASPAMVKALKARVLAPGELEGFAQVGRSLAGVGAASWIGGLELPSEARAKEVSRLERAGFRAGIREKLAATKNEQGEAISLAEQFASSQQARAELAKQVQGLERRGAHTVAVAAIPGARSVAIATPTRSGVNVEFADGSYYYVVGAGWPTSTSPPASPASVEAAAQHLYRRVHGTP
jgi:hypothetical protein